MGAAMSATKISAEKSVVSVSRMIHSVFSIPHLLRVLNNLVRSLMDDNPRIDLNGFEI